MSIHPGRNHFGANHLLAAMPATVLERVSPHLEPIRTDQGHVLIHADEPVERVYFPTSGMFSLVVRGNDGEAVEAAVVGREGMLGAAVVLGAQASIFEELCQIDGSVLALPVPVLCDQLESEPAMRELLLGYIVTLLHATARSVACNRLHVAEQRLARWFLQVRDHVESDIFIVPDPGVSGATC